MNYSDLIDPGILGVKIIDRIPGFWDIKFCVGFQNFRDRDPGVAIANLGSTVNRMPFQYQNNYNKKGKHYLDTLPVNNRVIWYNEAKSTTNLQFFCYSEN